MAGKVGSSSFSVLLADGYNLLTAAPQAFSHRIDAPTERTDGLGDTWEKNSPIGMRRLTITLEAGFFDDTTNATHTAFSASQTTSRILSLAYAGNVAGKPFVGAQGVYGSSYDVQAKDPGLTKANLVASASGQVDRGVVLQAHTQKSADWSTKTDGAQVDFTTDPRQQVIPITSNSAANPTVITTPVPHGLTTGQKVLIAGVTGSSPTINGERTVTVLSTTTFSVPVDTSAGSGGTGGTFVRSNTPNGGVGYLQVSQYAGFTGVINKIRHSADDVTYTDLIVFTNVTSGPTAERVEVAGTIERYLCATGTKTGSGTITPFVGFARNP